MGRVGVGCGRRSATATGPVPLCAAGPVPNSSSCSRVASQPFSRTEIRLPHGLGDAVLNAAPHEFERRRKREPVPNRDEHRLEEGVAARPVTLGRSFGVGVGRAQCRTPHGARVAQQVGRVAGTRAARLRQPLQTLSGEAVHCVQRLAYADGGDSRKDAEVAGEPEAVGVEDSVAVDQHNLRKEPRLRRLELCEERNQEVDLAKGKVAWNVWRLEHHSLIPLVHDLQRRQAADDYSGARIRLAILDKRHVHPTDEQDSFRVDQVCLDQPPPQPTLLNPPETKRGPTSRVHGRGYDHRGGADG